MRTPSLPCPTQCPSLPKHKSLALCQQMSCFGRLVFLGCTERTKTKRGAGTLRSGRPDARRLRLRPRRRHGDAPGGARGPAWHLRASGARPPPPPPPPRSHTQPHPGGATSGDSPAPRLKGFRGKRSGGRAGPRGRRPRGGTAFGMGEGTALPP